MKAEEIILLIIIELILHREMAHKTNSIWIEIKIPAGELK